MKTTSFKTRAGLFFIVFGFICPVFAAVVPFLGLSQSITAGLVTFFVVGGPEVFIAIGAFLAGKEGVLLVKNKVKSMLGLPEGEYAATKSQYNIGLAMILLWFVVTLASGYIPGFFDIPFVHDNLLWLSIGADVLLLVAIFGFGGHQLITKIGRVFSWEEWEMPEKNN